MCYNTRVTYAFGHSGSTASYCKYDKSSRECPPQETREVKNYNECRTCQESNKIGRIEKVIEKEEIDDLSKMFGRRM